MVLPIDVSTSNNGTECGYGLYYPCTDFEES